MRRTTLQLFQLFLVVFATYAVLYDVPNQFGVVPFLCLVCMFFVGRHPQASTKPERTKKLIEAQVCLHPSILPIYLSLLDSQ